MKTCKVCGEKYKTPKCPHCVLKQIIKDREILKLEGKIR